MGRVQGHMQQVTLEGQPGAENSQAGEAGCKQWGGKGCETKEHRVGLIAGGKEGRRQSV